MLKQYSLSPLSKWPTGLLIHVANQIEKSDKRLSGQAIGKLCYQDLDKELESRIPEDLNDNSG